MAARPPKPPMNPATKSQSPDDSADIESFRKKHSPCSSTKISIMQLFHEMKQKYPTVPDDVVKQCVVDNFHDPENCVKMLENEFLQRPNIAQAYPSHVLRNNSNQSGIVKQLKPIRPAPLAPRYNLNNNKCEPTVDWDKNHAVGAVSPHSENIDHLDYNNITNVQKLSDMKHQIRDNVQPTTPNFKQVHQSPQRPTTLNFHETVQQHQERLERLQPHPSTGIVNRPVRKAPLPPVTKDPHSAPAVISHTHNFDQSFSSTTSIQSPDSGESEISVNICLSPGSERQRVGPPQRHISKLSVQPELPYTSLTSPSNQKSFTSLNLTLRKPSATPQSPIDITAGPGLTYSSSSYDPRRGYQKNFHITVNDQGGVFSASRVRPRSAYNPSVQYSEDEFNHQDQPHILRPASSEQNMLLTDTGGVGSPQLLHNSNNSQVIDRQRTRKMQLTKALEKNKKRLDQVQHEIEVLTSPVTPGESERLDREIESLRCDCEDMLNKIELASRSGLHASNNVLPNSNNINIDRQEPFPMQRPPPHPPLTPLQPHVRQIQSPLHQQSTSPIQQQQQHPMRSQFQQHLSFSTSSTSADDEQSESSSADDGPQWTCSMCTFQNHPLLNKCEYCENVRIIPGTIRIVPSSTSPLPNELINPTAAINNSSTPSPSVTASLTSASAIGVQSSPILLSRLTPNLTQTNNSILNSSNSNSTENDNLTHLALHT